MPSEIRTFTEQDIDEAARLLAARHRRDRMRTPALSPRFDDAAAVRSGITAELAKPLTHGVVAVRDGDVEGFLIGTVSLPPASAWYAGFGPRRSGEIAYAGYAAAGSQPYELYRQMYAALAPFFVRYGAFAHAIEINAGDETAMMAWFSLGFGQAVTLAECDTAPAHGKDTPTPAGVEMHQARTEDIEVVLKLADDLGRHHNGAPIFLPYLPEETDPGFRAYQLELLAKPENLHWVAYRDREAVGMQTFHKQDFAELARPDRSIYLFLGVTAPEERGAGLGSAILAHAMRWAREQEYERCTLHFFSANIAGARFWLGHGFRPLAHRLVRQLDERIAWANVSAR